MNVIVYDGQYSITFDEVKKNASKYQASNSNTVRTERNTWTDWFLLPSTRPVVTTPTVKTSSIEIPGANGLLDTTEALTGYPTYGNSSGSFEFILDIDRSAKSWIEVYNELKGYFHGRELKMILTDEPDYYYIGRFKVNQWKSDKEKNLITIDYETEPYRRSIMSSIGDWLWDSFNFRTGVIYERKFAGLTINSASAWTTAYKFDMKTIGNMPVVPRFNIDLTDNPDPTAMTMGVKVWNKFRQDAPVEGVLKATDTTTRKGSTLDPRLIFMTPDEYDIVEVRFQGVGTVDIEFIPGRL